MTKDDQGLTGIFLRLAEEYTLPCLRTARPEDLSTLTNLDRKAMEGYSNIQIIGVESEITSIVPFLGDDRHTTNDEFWMVPPGSCHIRRILPQVPNFGYVHTKKRKAARPTQDPSPPVELDEKHQEEVEEMILPDSELPHSELAEIPVLADLPALPDDWGAKMEDAKIGTLAMIQVMYPREKCGIAVVEVLFFFLSSCRD